MADFQTAIPITLKNEGSTFTAVPSTGEVVKWGVTLRTYRDLVDSDATADTIKNLTEQQASDFYRKYFWEPLHLDDVQDQTLAAKIFDLGVNMGIGTITRIVQQACNVLGHAVTVDGHIGVLTLAAINLSHPPTLLDEIRNLAAARYREIAANDPKVAGDLPGWLTRLAS